MRQRFLGLIALAALCTLPFPAVPQTQEKDWEQKTDAAVAALEKGSYREAEELALAALQGAKAFAEDDVRRAVTLHLLGLAYHGQVRYREAEESYRRSLAIYEKVLGPEAEEVATNLVELGRVCLKRNRHDEAESHFRRAGAIREKTLGPEHPETAATFANVGLIYIDLKKYAEAEKVFRRVIGILEKDPEMRIDLALQLSGLAVALIGQNQMAAAEPVIRRTLALQTKEFGPDHFAVAATLKLYATVLRNMNRAAEAEQLEKRALAIEAKRGSSGPP